MHENKESGSTLHHTFITIIIAILLITIFIKVMFF